MLGELTNQQIDHILHAQLIGRIGCCTGDQMLIMPVTYAYHEGFIYAHSRDGEKIRIMRKNSRVCFQVDAIENMKNWRSVVIWGEYEELVQNKDQLFGMEILSDRLAPFTISETVSAAHRHEKAPLIIEKGAKPVVYRIKVTKKNRKV
jgi:nitroimidazol reductase NimA-like FMN-containing flavoprotein (pyridoxamine 5'-phosphate oxidase superfamily)